MGAQIKLEEKKKNHKPMMFSLERLQSEEQRAKRDKEIWDRKKCPNMYIINVWLSVIIWHCLLDLAEFLPSPNLLVL